MRQATFVFLFLLSVATSLFAQRADSLERYLSQDTLYDASVLSNVFYNSLLIDDSLELANVYLVWGNFLNDNQKYDSAEKLFLKSIALHEPLTDKSKLANAKMSLAAFYRNADKIAPSLELAHEAYDIYFQLQDSTNIFASLKAIAINHDYIGDHEIAIKYYNECATIAKQIGLEIQVANIYHNLGGIYSDERAFEKALRYYDNSKRIAESLNNIELLTSIYQGLYLTYRKMELMSEAYSNLKKQYQYALKSNDAMSIAFAYQDFGTYYLAQGNYDSSIYYSSKALDLAKKLNKAQIITNAYESLRRAYYSSKAYKQAYDYFEKEVAMNDSLYNTENSQLIAAIKTEFETEKKERALAERNLQLQAAEYSLRKQETYLITLILFLLSVVIISVLIYRGYALRKKANSLLKKKNDEIGLQNEKIKAVDQMKSRWFINVAHELRTPLTLIKGPVQKILNSKSLAPDQEEDLSIVFNNTKRLVKLVNEILDLSKLEEGEMLLNKNPVNVNDFMSQIISIFQSRSQQSQINIEWMPIDKPFLNIDQDKVSKIVVNLISNAIRFSEPGSSVIVKAEFDDEIKISVSDSGPGIDPEDLPHVFDRFYQTESPKNTGGTGVGLALSKEIAELHGGHLSVKSDTMKGAKFTLHLPLSLKIDNQEIAEPSVELAEALEDNFISTDILSRLSKKPCLLLVEDNGEMRHYISSLLKPYFEVKEADNGMKGIEIMKNQPIKLIVSDMMMPGMDGLTFAKKIKANEDWKTIPFVHLSAISDDFKVKEALRIGVDDYLQKPFDPEELIIRIQNLYQNAVSRMEATPELTTEVSYDDKILRKLQDEVIQNIADANFNVLRLADCAAMSERQIYRYLKSATGLTPLQFIQEIKLNKALEMAKKRIFISSNELATAVGFQHSPYFSSLFEKRFGKKPSAYLKAG